MRNYDKYRSTKFIQKSDVEKGILVTIDKVTEENVAPEYQVEEIKYVIHFKEGYKPWAPGIETLDNIKHIAGTGNVDDWPETKLVLFIDPEVKFGRKKVGGIRCRAPKSDQSITDKGAVKAQFCDKCRNLKEECTCDDPSPPTGDIPF